MTVSQEGSIMGQVQVLPDSRSVVDIMSSTLAHSLGLNLHKVPDTEFQLTVANGENIIVSNET